MDYSATGPTRACIDWIDLEINSVEKHVAHRILKHLKELGVSFVRPLDIREGRQGRNTPSKRFVLRLQDPGSIARCRAIEAMLNDKFPLAEPVQVAGIEVAVDTYHPDKMVLAQIALSRYRYLRHPIVPSTDHRLIYRSPAGRPDVWQSPKHPILIPYFRQGRALFMGQKHANLIMRIYVKTADNGLPLSSDEYRVRVEVRLQGEQVPFKTLEQMEAFNFSDLACYFKWLKERPDIDPDDQKALKKITSLGQPKDATKNAHHARQTRCGLIADSKLNKTAADALRNLTRSVRTKKGAHESIPEIHVRNSPLPIERTAPVLNTINTKTNTSGGQEQFKQDETMLMKARTASRFSHSSATVRLKSDLSGGASAFPPKQRSPRARIGGVSSWSFSTPGHFLKTRILRQGELRRLHAIRQPAFVLKSLPADSGSHSHPGIHQAEKTLPRGFEAHLA